MTNSEVKGTGRKKGKKKRETAEEIIFWRAKAESFDLSEIYL